ncbi:hypothetical protein MIMGU_mgv1a025601mg [Erythranthe guttata]|uniref:RING-type E3 ubiquitin transferase n=2 Tax=Erythranthe guttata TaxID=4155 RepID=A0A022PVQ2_ERYGU|nr:hypothetical protein MIMGU_mgv1a025601mg [Erythranthe guttata]
MNPLHPSMAIVLLVLSLMFCLTFLIVAYAKFCHSPTATEPPGGGGGAHDLTGPRSRFSGLDRTLIETLPFFRFSSLKGSKDGLECSVCLSRFDESEILRLLPKCRHAFHMSCIDKWLESHSSCPLCRHKFDIKDLKSLSYTNSFRISSTDDYDQDQPPNLEFFIQREQNQERPSSRFNNMANTLQRLYNNTGKKSEEPLIINNNQDYSIMHNVKHRIIVSDVMHKSRWSDVNSSDLISLNSEMLMISATYGTGFSSPSGRLTYSNEVSAKEQILKIKEDMERKKFVESKVVVGNGQTSSGESSSMMVTSTKSLDSGEKRSMSEITSFSRFKELRFGKNVDEDENVARVWLPIARRTIQKFADQEITSDNPRLKYSVNNV